MDILTYNREAWNNYVDSKNRWTVPVEDIEIKNAKDGNWSIILTPTKAIPKSWFPQNLEGLNILGLAAGGGQQGPILASAGANVTIFDNSPKQLEQDQMMAEKHNLPLKVVQGDMRDLSIFEDETFDIIINPCSISFVEDIQPIWNESFRVLKKGGVLMTGLTNPLIYQIDDQNLMLTYKAPYSDLHSLEKEKLEEFINNKEALLYGHSWQEQLGGQLQAGFLISDMYEDDWSNELIFDSYFPGFMATRAIKL